MSDAEMEAVTVGGARRLDGPIEIAEYDPDWPRQFDREALRIRAALGGQALAIEHVGSTAVPGLAAKPIIDIHLVVAERRSLCAAARAGRIQIDHSRASLV